MDDLTAFVTARLDEDERFAKIARLAQQHREQMLREVEAKRAIIAAHGPDPLNRFGSVRDPLCLVCLTNREGYEDLWEADPWPCLTLRALVAVYGGHPDYRPEWKP